MSNADPLMRLIRVLEDELRTPPTERRSGASDDGLRSAIMDARQAVLEVEHHGSDDVRTAMAQAPASSRRLWSQVAFDGRRTVDLTDAPQDGRTVLNGTDGANGERRDDHRRS